MRRGSLRKQWTVGTFAAIGLGAMACSTTNSKMAETGDADLAQVAAPSRATDLDLGKVYFELDSAVLPEEGRESLKMEAQKIQSNPDWKVVTIEGHCDERGSEEYNLALGERRADAVKQYLSDLGVPDDRLETRSYGEMKPAAFGHDEQAWSENRRAELEIGD